MTGCKKTGELYLYLNKREAEFIVLALRGWSLERMALQLCLSFRTVTFYMKDLQLKLESYLRSSGERAYFQDEMNLSVELE